MNNTYSPAAVDLDGRSETFANIDYDLDVRFNQYRYTEDRTLAHEVIRMEALADLQAAHS